MPPSLSITKIAPSHLDECAVIDTACTSPAEGWSVQDFADYLAWSNHGAHVAMWEHQVVGFVIFRADRGNRRLQLVRIGVAPRWQRRRIGSRLMNHLRDWLRALPDLRFGALVPERNLAMQCFLRAVGFRAVRVWPGCFRNGGDDGYWFESTVSMIARSPLARGETEVR